MDSKRDAAPDAQGQVCVSAEADELFENIAVPLHWVGPDGTILWANQAELDLMGYSRDEYVGRSIASFHVDEHVIADILASLNAEKTLRDYPARLRRKDGTIRDALITSNVLWRDGRFLHTRCVTRDVTEQKRATEALREQARRLEALNRIGRLLAAELDLQRLVQAITDAATELSGAAFGAFFYNVKDEKGGLYQLYTISGVPREAFSKFPMPRNTEVFAPTFSGTGVVRSDDITRDPRYGKNHPHRGQPPGHLPVRSYLAVPVISRAGEVLGGLFFGHPDTGIFTEESEGLVTAIAAQAAIAMDNAQLYQALRNELAERARIEAMLREANERKDEFLAMLAHELRNPLAPIHNGLQLLRETSARTETAQQTHAIMERQLNHLVRLVDDLLEVSRMSGGRIELRRERIDLADVIGNAVDTSRPALDASQHELHVELPSDPLFVEADPMRLAQVFSNLLANAARYTPNRGRITVTACSSGGQALISVRDNGLGIPAEALPRVFDMFWQGPAAAGQARSGLGIGLTLARSFVDLHGGTIEARSEGAGHGSEFTVHLPLAPAATPAVAARPPQPARIKAPRRVLIVDDNVDAAETLGKLLREHGHSVHVAHGGRQGIAAARTVMPQVMLLDLAMPDMDGFEVARELRSDPAFGNLRIVALTGFGGKRDLARTQKAGFDDHIVKPARPETINSLIERLTAGSAGERSSA